MTIREYLRSLGASENELTAKVVSRMEKQMLFDSDIKDFSIDTVVRIVENATGALEKANGDVKTSIANAAENNRLLQITINDSKKQLADLEAQTAGIKDAKINSPETRDGVMAFAATLNAVKQIFGQENITPDVMVAAINAGSYIAWRGIMGPKDVPEIGFPKPLRR